MNKQIKYLAVAAVAAVGLSAQARAASVSINLSCGGVSISVCEGHRRPPLPAARHDIMDKRHLDHCGECRHKAARRFHQPPQAPRHAQAPRPQAPGYHDKHPHR